MFGQTVFTRGQCIVLAGDEYAPGCHLANRVVDAMSTILEAHVRGPQGSCQQLLTQPDTKKWHACCHEVATSGEHVRQSVGVSWPARQHHAVRLHGQYIGSGCTNGYGL